MSIPPEMRAEFETALDSYELEGNFRRTGLLLLAAGLIGTNPEALSHEVNLPVEFIQERETRLRDGLVWIGDETHANWADDGTEFLLHILLAEGVLTAEHKLLD